MPSPMESGRFSITEGMFVRIYVGMYIATIPNRGSPHATTDWLLERQGHIEKKLAALGHNRDGKKGKLQVNYGLLTNQRVIPVSVSVFEGNTGDPRTLLPQVDKVRKDFGIEQFVLVGDRGVRTISGCGSASTSSSTFGTTDSASRSTKRRFSPRLRWMAST